MFLLDTNVVSELRRGQRAHEAVRRWNAGVPLDDCWLSAVTMFELRLGSLLKQRRDPEQGAVLLAWIAQIEAAFAGRIADVTVEEWTRCADLHVPDPRPLRDSLLAAAAIHRRLTLVTRNTRDFVGMPVPLVDPWSA